MLASLLFLLFLCCACPAQASPQAAAALTAEEYTNKRDLFYQHRDALLAERARLEQLIEEAQNPPQKKNRGTTKKNYATLSAMLAQYFIAITGAIITCLAAVSYLMYWLRLKKRHATQPHNTTDNKSTLSVLFFAAFLSNCLMAIDISSVHAADSPVNEMISFRDKVSETSEIILLDDIDKAIRLLEKRKNKSITLQDTLFNYTEPLVKPHITVTVDGIEYFYLLASLSHLKNDSNQTVFYLNKMMNLNFQDMHDEKRRVFVLFRTLQLYHGQGKIEQATFVANTLVKYARHPEQLLNILRWLLDKSLLTPGIAALDELGRMQLKPEQGQKAFETGLTLTTKLLKGNQFEPASLSMEKTLVLADSYEKLREYVVYSFKQQLERSAMRAIEVATTRPYPIEQLLDLTTAVYAEGKTKLGAELLKKIITKAGTSENLTTIALYCIDKEEIALAIQALQILFNHFSLAGNTHSIPPPDMIYAKNEIPTENRIKLLSLMGICYQKENKMALAEAYYRKAVELELEDFIASGGLNREININNMFYLVRTYAGANNLEMMRLLDPVYSFLEQKYLDQLTAHNRTLAETLAELGKNVPPPPVAITLLEKIKKALLSGSLALVQMIAYGLMAALLIAYPWLLDKFRHHGNVQ